jgi:hypothetical protein
MLVPAINSVIKALRRSQDVAAATSLMKIQALAFSKFHLHFASNRIPQQPDSGKTPGHELFCPNWACNASVSKLLGNRGVI